MDFQKAVIERSFDLPVVVDFWAAWCNPCRVLGPVIEQLAEEQAGRWELVKVNTEEQQAIAAQYGIRSIPNVKLFHKGEVIAEFAGALPRTQILQWLDEQLPDDRKIALQALKERWEQGTADPEEIETFADHNADLPEARQLLARTILFSKPERALALLPQLQPNEKGYEENEDLKVLAELMKSQPETDQAAGKALLEAKQALQAGNVETAIKQLIEATGQDKSYLDDLPRRSAIALFRILGSGHVLTKAYRWKFDMALY